jgi:tetratricopeptide (TPR) repeat protein
MRSVRIVWLACLCLMPIAASAQSARERAEVPYRLALEQMRAEDWNEAVKSFSGATELDPTFDLAFYMLGRVHLAQKHFSAAVSAWERCRELNRAQLGRQYANAQERMRYRDTRLQEIDELIRSYQSGPQSVRTADALRQLQNRRREVQEAMSRGQSTMTLDLSIPAYVSLSLGSAYFRLGRLADAEKAYNETIASDPGSGEAYNNLAVIYMETARYAEAEKAVTAAERTGLRVPPALKEEIARRKKTGS